LSENIQEEFANAELNDERRSRRLCKVVEAMAQAPEASLAAACGGWAETVAAYRLLGSEELKPEALLEPHRRAVVERCRAFGCVAVSQDTTELDFTRMKAAKGLGVLNEESRRGFFMHSLYAASEEGLPLGILQTGIVARPPEDLGNAAKRKHLPIEDKESWRWVDGYLKSSQLAAELPDCEVFSISDREGDIFEIFEAWQKLEGSPRAEWIIRANQDRALVGLPDGQGAKLFEALAEAPVLGEVCFEMRARKGTRKVKGSTKAFRRSARRVHQVIRAMEIEPRPPYRKAGKLPEVSFHAIMAEEVDPPAGEEPVRWLLLTSKQIGSLADARRIINLYLGRWDIEVFHKVLKTGCRVERIQLKEGRALVNAIAIYAVIAWRILYLTHLGRQCPELPCGCVFDESEWKAACAVVKRDKDASEPTLGEFVAIVGKLGGHLGRKRDGPPGPQSMWRGLMRIRDFAFAWQTFHGC
jgi:hypothetical protein